MAGEDLTDDYVASLLAKDAKESSIKYSSVGLEAFGRSKPPANKPKPNTRFLRNIIKDTDSHNAALLAKEAAESRARLKSLAPSVTSREKTVAGADIRRRQLGDIAAILGGRSTKRKREERGNREGKTVNYSSEDEEKPRSKKSKDKPEETSGVKRQRERDRDEGKEGSGRSRDHRSSRRDRSPSEDRRKDRERRRHRSPRERRDIDDETRIRRRSPRRKRSRSPETDRSGERSHRSHRSHRHRRSPSTERKISKAESKQTNEPDYDSDPLDDIIGPRPPPIPEVKCKGRGIMSKSSGIDSRFSANYDPTADVQLDFDEENDWDQALEALRDRTKWKQQGADRLRAAGFTDEEVSKWERGGEKREEDVKWSKKGEGREWDRGKIVSESGFISIQAKFGESTLHPSFFPLASSCSGIVRLSGPNSYALTQTHPKVSGSVDGAPFRVLTCVHFHFYRFVNGMMRRAELRKSDCRSFCRWVLGVGLGEGGRRRGGCDEESRGGMGGQCNCSARATYRMVKHMP
ncbi:pre-mRNA-splicing factor 38B [Drepanopeziza brunnea f. sp. 'multigermtubi' MB_m1]|uniref:Pre-mRNA-splicing factor 38B n=1 Tax=Marssonina brunnea f. sp. multigermtubi (strain MB_m1) TaxID=1072389 RepID=K1WV13_MARBU|nr:pre-mRNA-splicing factor 38B [Drepanopeziza brunnea f. sp. 'multigermtubi' MB_m1]EKD21495.1 pre-mRNA-splicing factor 38B [Drepanopeziza brunnea f. sp. 'multigermtubi' MB_m1]